MPSSTFQESSAICAIEGPFAESLPVFHLVGMPSLPTQAARAIVHDTLGNGEYELFRKMAGSGFPASLHLQSVLLWWLDVFSSVKQDSSCQVFGWRAGRFV
jgi:hypothetical protein